MDKIPKWIRSWALRNTELREERSRGSVGGDAREGEGAARHAIIRQLQKTNGLHNMNLGWLAHFFSSWDHLVSELNKPKA